MSKQDLMQQEMPRWSRSKRRHAAASAMLLSLALTACGGGGGEGDGGEGNGGGGDPTTKGWGTAALLETIDFGDAKNVRVAMNASGEAVVVWEQMDSESSNMSIFARVYQPAGGWGAVTVIEKGSEVASAPAVAIDGNGRAIVVWSQSDGERTNIWRTSYDPVTGWNSANLLETDDQGSADSPAIAMDAAGRATVAWRQKEGGGYFNIKARRYAPGSGWGAVTLIELEELGNAGFPSVSMHSNGSAMVVWRQNDGVSWNVWAARYDMGPGWDATVKVDNTPFDVQAPHVAHDMAGNAIVTWRQAHFETNKLVMAANMYRPGTGWSGVSGIGGSAAHSAFGQRVVAWGAEKFAFFWYQENGGITDVYWGRVDGSFKPAKLLETDNSGSAFDPKAAFVADGSGVATWLQSDGMRTNIWSAQLNADGTSGIPELLETDNTGNALSPELAMASSGNAIAVWTQHDGKRYNVWYNMRQQ